jgi:hypothetical protein
MVPQAAQVHQPVFRGARAIGTDQDRAVMTLRVGDLRQRGIGHHDVGRPRCSLERSRGATDRPVPRRCCPETPGSGDIRPRTRSLNVGAAACISLWQVTRLASISTTLGLRPPALAVGKQRPSSDLASQGCSRAGARARRNPASMASSTPSRTRHAVAVDATGPKQARLVTQDCQTQHAKGHRAHQRSP